LVLVVQMQGLFFGMLTGSTSQSVILIASSATRCGIKTYGSSPDTHLNAGVRLIHYLESPYPAFET
jgi:hypothetical protein